MFNEYDVIIAKSNLENTLKGSKGTVLIVYDDKKHYEIEFVDAEGNTLSVLTVSEAGIEKCNNSKYLDLKPCSRVPFEGAKGYGTSRATSWELYQIYSNPEALRRTVFYIEGKVV